MIAPFANVCWLETSNFFEAWETGQEVNESQAGSICSGNGTFELSTYQQWIFINNFRMAKAGQQEIVEIICLNKNMFCQETCYH